MTKNRIFLPTGRPEIDVEYPSDVRTASAKRRWRRIKRWDAGERPRCVNHPGVIVNRSTWINGQRLCRQCANLKGHSPSALRNKARFTDPMRKGGRVRVWRAEA